MPIDVIIKYTSLTENKLEKLKKKMHMQLK